uniref:Uncharacterized protein LOC117359684 n=1 Tax=Geotrypetes seraphini TaxID=260995 RepID=A0A6P8RDV0_GEOSA|nr:uncharacterized protein LOC117359684 [Geotrypetes seraphini]
MASAKTIFTLPAQSFCCSRKSNLRSASEFTAIPFCVEFQRLLRQKKPDIIIPGISVQDLLYIVVALYDVYLPNIGVEDLQACICARGAKTTVLIRDELEVVDEYKQKASDNGKSDCSTTIVENFFIKKEEKEKSWMLSAIFSDSESSDEDNEIESIKEDKERFNTDMKKFITCVQERRKQRNQMQDTGASISPQSIGIESRIVAAMTFQRSVLKSKEVVVRLLLLSTRKRYQHSGAGHYMVELLKDPSFVGAYDAILTHADQDAVTFFKHCDFNDDVLLNSKFREFEEEWTYTTTMSFFPPFNMGKKHFMDIKDIEVEMEFWKTKSLAAYQTQTILMNKMFLEIKTLRKQSHNQ